MTRFDHWWRRITLSALLALLFGFISLHDATTARAAEWPTKPVTIVVGFGAGGSADRTARAMSSFLPDVLGQPVLVVNKKGAGSQLGATYVLQQPNDCYTVFGSALSPFLPMTILTGGAKYSLDDFAFINGQWFDYDLMFTSKNSRFKSFKELFTAAKNKPRTVKMALIKGGSNELNIHLTMDALGIPFKNLNVVNYSGGGAARTSAAGGTTDFAVIAGEGTEGVRDLVRPLAVYRNEPHKAWDAPAINSVIKDFSGKSIPIIDGSMRGFAVSAACKKEHPERFDKLVNTFKTVLGQKGVKKFLKRSKIGGEYIGPEKTTQVMKSAFKLYSKYNARVPAK